jgi:hypothetical protein
MSEMAIKLSQRNRPPKSNESSPTIFDDATWIKMEAEAEDDIRNGRVYGPFKTHGELIEFLKNCKLRNIWWCPNMR